MPVRATKRGADRTPLRRDVDVVVCGASFAGLAVARELRGTGARVLVVDRYEIGERQTSACAAPTEWLREPGPRGLDPADLRLPARPHRGRDARWPLPWTFSTFDYRELCRLLWEQPGRRRVRDREGRRPHRLGGAHRPRRRVGAARGRRAGLAPRARHGRERAAAGRAALARPGGAPGRRRRRPRAVDRQPLIRAGYGWSFPAGDELRVGVGSFDPRDHVKEPTVALARSCGSRRALPGQLDPPPDPPGGRGGSSSPATPPATACR